MVKKLLVTFLSLLGLTLALPGHAVVTAAGNFNVALTLTSKCEINSTNAAAGAVITDLAMSYTSFQSVAATGSTSFNVRCTNSLPYTLALDSATVTDNALNLVYDLSLSASGATGNGTNQSFTVNGSIASGQAGSCATASCTNTGATNKQRTLTVSY